MSDDKKSSWTSNLIEIAIDSVATMYRNADSFPKRMLVTGRVIVSVLFSMAVAVIYKFIEGLIIGGGLVGGIVVGTYFALAMLCPLFGFEPIGWLATFIPIL